MHMDSAIVFILKLCWCILKQTRQIAEIKTLDNAVKCNMPPNWLFNNNRKDKFVHKLKSFFIRLNIYEFVI